MHMISNVLCMIHYMMYYCDVISSNHMKYNLKSYMISYVQDVLYDVIYDVMCI